MPLPLIIPILIGAGTAALGTGKGIKAAVDNSKAKNINKSANTIIEEAKENLEESRKASNTALEALGSKKLYMWDKSLPRFIASFEKLKNVQLTDSVGLDELSKFRLDNQSLAELKEMKGYASSIIGGIAAGSAGGALAGIGAYGGVHLMATTGILTGKAIFGAAAGNATLAFLGGGSLAAGGLGMAGGAVVLGGLVAGPALAIMGFIIGAKASANLDNARSNLAEAKKIEEELKIAGTLCNGIRRRSYMFERLLIRLDALLMPDVFAMENIIANKGCDFNDFNDDEKKTIASAASIIKAIKTVIDTPILTEDGKLTDESDKIIKNMKFVDNQMDDSFLFIIEDFFTIQGRGTIVTGTVQKGIIKLNQKIEIIDINPKKVAVITSIESCNKLLDEAKKGDYVGLLLKGVDKNDLKVGQKLVSV
jgi:hypothetical protein